MEKYSEQGGISGIPTDTAERSGAYKFEYTAPEIPGKYVLWLDVNFARAKGYHVSYYYYLEVK